MPFPPMETAFFVCLRPARHLYCLRASAQTDIFIACVLPPKPTLSLLSGECLLSYF